MNVIDAFSGLVFFLFFGICLSFAQIVELNGEIIASGDVENIHIINISSKSFTTSNAAGKFKINAKAQDTLQFSSVKYKTATLMVGYGNVRTAKITVYLEDQVNVLDEVIVGKVLTGKLDSDIENSDAERSIDFYDLGLPGYVGKPLTQSERRLAEASKGQPGTLAILPIINAITGRTKMLKERVRLERNANLMRTIKENLSEGFFATHPLETKHREEFFQYSSEKENFESRCRDKSEIEIFEFLEESYEEFLQNKNED